jgi:hypothetical protein
VNTSVQKMIGILHLLRLAEIFLIEEGNRRTVSIRVKRGRVILQTVKITDQDRVTYETYPVI